MCERVESICPEGVGLRLDGTPIARPMFSCSAETALMSPPKIRMAGIAAYSTRGLDFALNNGLAMTANGRLWASWIAGEDGPGAFTVASYSDDCGETWSDVALVIDGHGDRPGDTGDRGLTSIIGTFWLDPDGVFHLFTDQSLGHFDGRAGFWESICFNADAPSPVWSVPRRLGHGHLLNKPIVLANGHWALSGYLNWVQKGSDEQKRAFPELDGERGATCYVSTGNGQSWEKRGTARFPGKDWQEAQLVQLKDGVLRTFARVKDGAVGRMMAADSKDEGWSWSAPFILPSMDNPNARFQVVRLASGRLLFVTHGAPSDGGKDGQGRDHLTAYLSEDDGKTWIGGLMLFEGESSYPDVCQGPDGVICVTNDHDRGGAAEIWFHRFYEEDILSRHIVSSRGRLGLLVCRGGQTSKNHRG